MTNASRDNNNVPTLLGASNADGITPIAVQVSSTNHGLVINDGTSGTDHGVTAAVRDENFVPVLLAVSSADGVTPVEVYTDPSTGALLIQST